MAGPSLSVRTTSIYPLAFQSFICHSALKGGDGKQRWLQPNVMTSWQRTAPAPCVFFFVCVFLRMISWKWLQSSESRINCTIIVIAEPLQAKTRALSVLEGKVDALQVKVSTTPSCLSLLLTLREVTDGLFLPALNTQAVSLNGKIGFWLGFGFN